MTATLIAYDADGSGSPGTPQHPGVGRWTSVRRELSDGRYLARAALFTLAAILLGLSANFIVFGRLEQRSAQTRAFDHFREQLALGVAPIGQTDAKGRLLSLGTPVALLQIPSIGVSQVVLEGTTSGVLLSGPGHLRDTVLPGQAGTSVVFGRAAAYGGPFGGLHHLRVGNGVSVTTGIGVSTFKVIDVRGAGDPLPQQLAPGSARLTLVTATGWPFVPSGTLHVDADLVGTAQAGAPLLLTSVPHSELAMASDTGNLWGCIFVLQILIVLSVMATWSWRRWGAARTWITFLPGVILAAYYLSGSITRLLPNLM